MESHDLTHTDRLKACIAWAKIHIVAWGVAYLIIWGIEVARLYHSNESGSIQASFVSLSLLMLPLLIVQVLILICYYGIKKHPSVRQGIQLQHPYTAWMLFIVGSASYIGGVQSVWIHIIHHKIKRAYYQGLALALTGLVLCYVLSFMMVLLYHAKHFIAERLTQSYSVIKKSAFYLARLRAMIKNYNGVLIPILACMSYLFLDYLSAHIAGWKTLDFRPIVLLIIYFTSMIWVYVVMQKPASSHVIWTKIQRVILGTLPLTFMCLVLCPFSLWIAYGHMSDASTIKVQRDSIWAHYGLQWARRISDVDGDQRSYGFRGGDCDESDPKIRSAAYESKNKDWNCNGIINDAGQDVWNQSTQLITIPSSSLKSSSSKDAKKHTEASTAKGMVKNIAKSTAKSTAHNTKKHIGKQKEITAKNLVLLTIDALRYDTFRTHMPRLQKLAQQAIDFESAYSTGAATYWSIPSLIAAKYPSRFRMERDQTPHKSEYLLSEILQHQGFHTSLFANVTIFFVRGLRQGHHVSNYDTSHYTKHGAIPGAQDLSTRVIQHIGRWQAGRLKPKKDRFFVWAHYYDPHDPYFKVPQFQSTDHDLSRYQAIVRYVDQQVVRVITALKQKKLWKDTVVVLTADHGDEFLDHGHRFHGRTLYEEMVHVPLLIFTPHSRGMKVQANISHVDVAPTVASLLGIQAPKKFSGRDWSTWLHAKEQAQQNQQPFQEHLPDPVFFEVLPDRNYGKHLVGMRIDNYKMILDVNYNLYELYDLKKDPLERNNIYGQHAHSKVWAEKLAHYANMHMHILNQKRAGTRALWNFKAGKQKKRGR